MATMNSFGPLQRDVNWGAVLKSTSLTPEVQKHLTQVYSTLGATILMCALGCAVHISNGLGHSFLYQILSIGLIFYLAATPDNKQSRVPRFSALMVFGFIEGLTLGPLLQIVAVIDPRIIMTAFLGTICIFVCFSASAIFAERRSYFYLSAILTSSLSMLCFMSLLNTFMRSYVLFQIDLYFGLVLFCGFVIFDTQLVIEKRITGNEDYIWDSIGLFLDFVNIFVRLVIILTKDKKKSNSKD